MPPMKESRSRPTAKFSWPPKTRTIPSPSRTSKQAIETLAWDYLEIYYGWENNDGAFGTFVFDVPARTITLEHNERYTEVNTTSHEF